MVLLIDNETGIAFTEHGECLYEEGPPYTDPPRPLPQSDAYKPPLVDGDDCPKCGASGEVVVAPRCPGMLWCRNCWAKWRTEGGK